MNRKLVLLSIVLLAVQYAVAQSTFGSIVGVVKDPDQLVIPGAQVALTNLDDNSKRTTNTDADGAFQFMNVRAGHYEVVVEANGFAPYKMTSVQLDARQTLRLDSSLKLAANAEVIEVGAAAAAVNTENATIGDTKDFNQISELPVNYRGATTSPLAALAAVPGTQQDANGNVTVGGGIPSQVQYSVDGTSTVNIRQNGALQNMNPSSELISEFKVAEFNNNAEFAQMGDVTITTKSGNEHFHGSAFEYLQNSLLDATPYGFDTKAHKAFNTFGGSFSGPVDIPKLSSSNHRTFFFVDYEANRRRYTTPEQYSVPTQAMRFGDLSSLVSTPLMDPFIGQPFPGSKIPMSRISPDAANLLQLYVPQPNSANSADTNANDRQQVPTPSDTNGYDVRMNRPLLYVDDEF